MSRDVYLLKQYLRSRGFQLGKGIVMKKVMDAITHGTEKDLHMLDKVMRDPRQASALLELMFDDLSGNKQVRRKVRRGRGSY